MTSANTRKIRKSERLALASLSLEELMQIKSGKQDFLLESVLFETIQTAVSHKIEAMQKMPLKTHPWLTYWLICELKSGRGVGVIGSKSLPDEDGYVELGYAIAAECRGQGYLPEAMTEFLDWLYEWPFCSGAVLYIQPSNRPSLKAAQKCGFCYEQMYMGYRRYRYIF